MFAHAPAGAESKRPDIERAALRLFVRRGLRGTTVRDIAAGAGVAEGTLYRHWRSKRDLARSIYRSCADTLAGDLRRAIIGRRTSRARLQAAIGALFRSARDEMLVLPPDRTMRDFVDGTGPAGVLAEIVAEGQRRGEFAPLDPRLAGECIVGIVHRVAISRRLGTLPGSLTQYEPELARAVLAGLTASSRRRAIA